MTGAPYSLSAMFAGETFEVIAGEPVVGGMRGGEIDHMFCPNCMSWVFTRVMDGAFINLRSTMMDDTSGTKPFVETCTSEKLDWVTTPAQHSFEKFPEMDAFTKLMEDYAAHR